MAWIEYRNGKKSKGVWRISFRLGDQRFNRSLKTGNQKEAETRQARLEESIRLVESGRIQIPPGADVATFLLSDGKLTDNPIAVQKVTVSQLFQDFFDSLPEGNLEDTTLDGMQRHRRHVERIFGEKFPVQSLNTENLQNYVSKRSKEKGSRGRKVGANTIHKELVTFRTVWGWGTDNNKVQGVFPRKGVRLPKAKEMPPFQTWEEIERQIHSSTTDQEQADLWECLYLSMKQLEELLKDVERMAAFPFIHPMFCFAAYTGARRSELMRSQISDIDFAQKVITIREKKRVRGQHTTRRVPLSQPLEKVLRGWFKNHPGGTHTFCHHLQVARSITKRTEPIALTPDEAAHHFKHTLKESKWKVIPGWHCLRHSFISNCACKGIDQRMIDEWVGHTTEVMRRRYRHLFPSTQQDAMKLLFT